MKVFSTQRQMREREERHLRRVTKVSLLANAVSFLFSRGLLICVVMVLHYSFCHIKLSIG